MMILNESNMRFPALLFSHFTVVVKKLIGEFFFFLFVYIGFLNVYRR